MPTLELQRPFETTEPRLRVESILLPGRHRFRLIVVDNDGIESDPVDTLVTIVGQVPSGDALVRAREARGRVFYATGVLLDAHHLDAEQLYDHRWLARALSYLHGSGTLAGLEVRWEKATGGAGVHAYGRCPEGAPGRDLRGVARGRRLVGPRRP